VAVNFLDDSLWFPPVEEARADGLLAVGGDLRTDRLLLAYRSGIFPWYNEHEMPHWWSPDPRFVLFPDELKVSRSMQRVIDKGEFELTVNTAFEQVIRGCATAKRKGMDGTWIGDDMIEAYLALHRLRHAYSAETWKDGQLVGGLYGVLLGKVFFGESMFSKADNASKYAFILFVAALKQLGVVVIDCQVYTAHLESLGARMIPRKDFMEIVQKNVPS